MKGPVIDLLFSQKYIGMMQLAGNKDYHIAIEVAINFVSSRLSVSN